MELFELSQYIDNEVDKFIFKSIGSSTQDTNNYAANIISSTISIISEPNNSTIKTNVEYFNDDSFASLCVYCNLLPYMNMMLEKYEHRNEVINKYLIILKRYLNQEIGKMQFVENLWEIQSIVGISYKFFDKLIDYFICNKQSVKNKISIG